MNDRAIANQTDSCHADPYLAFLERKVPAAGFTGVQVDPAEVNPLLKPHCRALVPWALEGGRRAIFARFGLHKTAMQIEKMRLLGRHGADHRLIVLPLGVRREFFADAARWFQGEHAVALKFIRSADEVDSRGTIYLTNYETVRDGRLDPNLFDATSLDEAAVLRSFGSKTYQTFLTLFDQVRYRFVSTAMPNPNRPKEILHYAAYLGIMDTGQALTRWFQRNSEQANDLTLYPHKEREFWLWVSTWAVFLQRPSDLGFSDEGYTLPPSTIRWHEIASNLADGGYERDGQGILLRGAAHGLVEEARERRETLADRIAKMMEIRATAPAGTHFVIWHDLEDERRAIEQAIPGIATVYGSQDLEERERLVEAFSDGEIAELATKPSLNGSGSNFQRHCHRMIVLGVNHKAHDFYQLLFRIQRYGQTRDCEVDVIHSEAEREVVRDLQQKIAQFEATAETMATLLREHGLSQATLKAAMARSIGVERQEVEGKAFRLVRNDTVLEARRLESDSIDLIVTSIPFANHYEYTPSYNDFGHTDGNPQFWKQMEHLTPELLRALAPGRLACIHVKDRILFGRMTGSGLPTVSPFHAEAIFHFIEHGFDYMGMITVTTDVVTENNGNYRLGWTENAKDSTKMGVGSPEYILILHKPQTERSKGYADNRVTKDLPLCRNADGEAVPFDKKLRPIAGTGYGRGRWQIDAHAFWRSSGNRLPTAGELARLGPAKLSRIVMQHSLDHIYDYEAHVEIAEQLDEIGALSAKFMSVAPGSRDAGVWHDVVRMRTLNSDQVQRNVEKHVCPLQFDIVDRLIRRYSNPGELVYDPFSGLGTVPLRAIQMGRRGAGTELNADYFRDAVHYLQAAEREASVPTIFDIIADSLAHDGEEAA